MASSIFEVEKQKFIAYFNDNIELLRNAELSFLTLIQSLLAAYPELSVSAASSRLKSRKESIRKFSRKYQSQLEKDNKPYEIRDYITDLIGVRIICLYEKNIQEVGDILRDNFCLIDTTDKSQLIEQAENTFGYKGLHLDLKLDETREVMPEYSRYRDIVFEVQIRTIIQDAWSVLDHKIKYKKSIPHGLKRRINSLAALFETADREFYSIREETEKLEQKTKDKSNSKDTQNEVLNVFHFAKISETYFPGTRLASHKVDALVDEIVKMKLISNGSFEKMVHDTIEIVKEFQEFLDGKHTMTFYTVIRHILYFCDRSSFTHILYENQRNAFDRWLEEKNSLS